MPKPQNFLLSSAKKNQILRLVSIKGGKQITHRLVEMGLTPGVEFEVLQSSGGPLLLSVRGGRIALGRGMADKLTVTIK